MAFTPIFPLILTFLMFASPITAGVILAACALTEFRKPRYTANNPFAQPVQQPNTPRVWVDEFGFMHASK